MEPDFEDLRSANVEARIGGEFMQGLQESDVPFEIVDTMEELIEEDDFGGAKRIIAAIEEEMVANED